MVAVISFCPTIEGTRLFAAVYPSLHSHASLVLSSPSFAVLCLPNSPLGIFLAVSFSFSACPYILLQLCSQYLPSPQALLVLFFSIFLCFPLFTSPPIGAPMALSCSSSPFSSFFSLLLFLFFVSLSFSLFCSFPFLFFPSVFRSCFLIFMFVFLNSLSLSLSPSLPFSPSLSLSLRSLVLSLGICLSFYLSNLLFCF